MVKMCIVMALSEDWEEEVRGKTKKEKIVYGEEEDC